MLCFSKFYRSLTGLAAVILLLGLGWFVFKELGRWLVVSDRLEKSPVAVVPTGELLERINTAVGLYRQGWVEKVLLTGKFPAFPVSRLKEIALEQGIPAHDILLEEESEGTYAHALATKKIMLERGWDKMILVTSPYHSRRARWIFQKVMAGDKIRVLSHPACPAWFQAGGWWLHSYSALEVRWEYKKLFYYWLSFGF